MDVKTMSRPGLQEAAQKAQAETAHTKAMAD
jgi:hypothetical protein